MSQNKYLLTDVLKKEWGFDGLIMSDWSGTYDGVEATNAGQDLEMPSGLHMNRATLKPAIEQGKVSVATVDDKVRRILRTALRFGWVDRDQTAWSIPRYNLQGRQVALTAAREGITLLKNDGGLLPLDKNKIKSILIIRPRRLPRGAQGRTGIAAADFSRIRNADLGRFTVDRLMSIINRLGSRIEVKIKVRRAETVEHDMPA